MDKTKAIHRIRALRTKARLDKGPDGQHAGKLAAKLMADNGLTEADITGPPPPRGASQADYIRDYEAFHEQFYGGPPRQRASRRYQAPFTTDRLWSERNEEELKRMESDTGRTVAEVRVRYLEAERRLALLAIIILGLYALLSNLL